MFLFCKISTLHRTALAIEITNHAECLEVICLDKAKVVRVAVIVVEHDDPSVLTETFPAVGSFVTLWLSIVILVVHNVWTSDFL